MYTFFRAWPRHQQQHPKVRQERPCRQSARTKPSLWSLPKPLWWSQAAPQWHPEGQLPQESDRRWAAQHHQHAARRHQLDQLNPNRLGPQLQDPTRRLQTKTDLKLWPNEQQQLLRQQPQRLLFCNSGNLILFSALLRIWELQQSKKVLRYIMALFILLFLSSEVGIENFLLNRKL